MLFLGLKCGEVTIRKGLPVTIVPRTLADIAASGLAEEQVHLAIQEATERGMTSIETLWQYAKKRGGRFYGILHPMKSIEEKV